MTGLESNFEIYKTNFFFIFLHKLFWFICICMFYFNEFSVARNTRDCDFDDFVPYRCGVYDF